ncbi:hypothetical protein U1Q18_050736 [Sarracenia purpurea var. burkii]
MSSDRTQTKPELSSGEPKEKKCKLRLFLGEGDFSYTEALINKHIDTHKNLARSIIATEFFEVPFGGADADVLKQRLERINSLKERGVRVHFKVDGRKLHEIPQLQGERFKRIHWNNPYRWSSISFEEFIQIITDFFSSCAKIQLKGDRIHLALNYKFDDDDWYDVRQYEQHVVTGSVQFGYTLIRKRLLTKGRYPGYHHKATENLEELLLPGMNREFIFEKDLAFCGPKTEEEILRSLPAKISSAKKTYSIDINKKNVLDSSKLQLVDCCFVCSTDDDSSDYDSSDCD